MRKTVRTTPKELLNLPSRLLDLLLPLYNPCLLLCGLPWYPCSSLLALTGRIFHGSSLLPSINGPPLPTLTMASRPVGGDPRDTKNPLSISNLSNNPLSISSLVSSRNSMAPSHYHGIQPQLHWPAT